MHGEECPSDEDIEALLSTIELSHNKTRQNQPHGKIQASCTTKAAHSTALKSQSSSQRMIPLERQDDELRQADDQPDPRGSPSKKPANDGPQHGVSDISRHEKPSSLEVEDVRIRLAELETCCKLVQNGPDSYRKLIEESLLNVGVRYVTKGVLREVEPGSRRT